MNLMTLIKVTKSDKIKDYIHHSKTLTDILVFR
jgi:hypothetical protein